MEAEPALRTHPGRCLRAALRWTSLIAILVIGGAAFEAAAQGTPGRGGPPPHVAEFSERLGLDEATAAKLKSIEREGRERGRALRLRLDVMHAELRELLGAEQPSESDVMKKADVIGALETDARKLRLRTMIRVRALLSAEQLEELVRIHGERKRRRGESRDGPRGPRHHGPPRF